MAKQFSIKAVFETVDKMTAPIKRMEASITSIASKSKSSGEQIALQMDKITKLSVKAASAEMAAAKAAQIADKVKVKGDEKVINAAEKAARATRHSADAINAALRSEEQALLRVGNAAEKMKRHFNFDNLKSKLRDFAAQTKSIIGSFTPGFGTLATVAGSAYLGKRVLDNSSEYESIETTAKGLIYSNPNFKKSMGKSDMNRLAYDTGKLAENAGNVSVGEYRDYANMANTLLARGIAPTKRLMEAFGSLAASMPSSTDKAGQFLDTLKSIQRGEVAVADNIPGVKGHVDKKSHEVFLEKAGQKYVVGMPGSKSYDQNLNNALTVLAEKYFLELGEMQGQTFEAKWSTMVSAMSRTLDDMMRKTSVWEKVVKPATERITTMFRNLSPQLTNLTETIFQKLSGSTSLSSTNIESAISAQIEDFQRAISQISDKDISDFISGAKSTGAALIDLGSAVASALPNLSAFFRFIAHPVDAVIGNDLKEFDKTTKNFTKSDSYVDRVVGNTLRAPIDAPKAIIDAISGLFSDSKLTGEKVVSTNEQQAAVNEQQNQLIVAGNNSSSQMVTLLNQVVASNNSIVSAIQSKDFNITTNITANGTQVQSVTRQGGSNNDNKPANTGRTPTGSGARKFINSGMSVTGAY